MINYISTLDFQNGKTICCKNNHCEIIQNLHNLQVRNFELSMSYIIFHKSLFNLCWLTLSFQECVIQWEVSCSLWKEQDLLTPSTENKNCARNTIRFEVNILLYSNREVVSLLCTKTTFFAVTNKHRITKYFM